MRRGRPRHRRTHFIDSGTALAGPNEVDHYLDTMRSVTKVLLTDFDKKYLVCG